MRCTKEASEKKENMHYVKGATGYVMQEEVPPGRGGGRDNVLYWENIEGGHGGAADNKQRAYMWALTYNFLWQALADAPAPPASRL